MVKNTNMTANDYLKLGAGAIAATAFLFFSYKIYSKIKSKLADGKETKDLRKEINYKGVTISESRAQSIADTIFAALNSNLWDDVNVIENELKRLKTSDDWKYVVIKFGKRKRETWFSNVDGGLDEWFADSLKDYELYRINQILSKLV